MELAGRRPDDHIASAVAEALGIGLSEDRASAEALAEQLRDRRILLLLLDNCEHVLDPIADVVATLLARCPDLTALTTSREPLGVPGETVWRVPPLELPAGDEASPDRLARLEAVQLFVERARDAAPSFALDESSAAAVARICSQLEGMPLAVELAAARLAHLSVGQLADRLGDLLALLAHRGRGRLDRQQTLAATLDWSHDLLDEDERVLFRRLAAFVGGFDLDAAGHVCGRGLDDIEAVLARLVDKSLVNADTAGEQARYRMLEVVRQYAESRLVGTGESGECRRLHRDWFAARAGEHDPDRAGPVVREPAAWFDREHDNIRAALASALEDDPALALRLATSTWRFWLSRGQIVDGLRWLARALDAHPESSLVRARALFATGIMQIRRGNAEPLQAIADEITAIHLRHGDATDYAASVHVAAVFAYMSGDHRRAHRMSELVDRLSAGVPTVAASSHHFVGIAALNVRDLVRARAQFQAAHAALAEVPADAPPFFAALSSGLAIGDRDGIPLPYVESTILHGRRLGVVQAGGHVTLSEALVERAEGRIDEALGLLDRARDTFRGVDDRYGEGCALLQRGHTLRAVGRWDEARLAFDQAGGLFAGLRHQRLIAIAMAGRALLEAATGQAVPARRLATEATVLMERSGDRPGVWYGNTSRAVVEVLLGEFAAALDCLGRAPDSLDIPGGQCFAGWQMLLRARLLRVCGDPVSATAAELEAAILFERFEDAHGLETLQRLCKADGPTLPVVSNSQDSEGET